MTVPALLHVDPILPSGPSATDPAAPRADGASSSPAPRWLVVLHGIYGMGRNWNSVARSLVRERPGWGALTVDLRGHGASLDATPPHTLEAAALDLLHTFRTSGRRPGALLGHSFGGKVALEYLRVAADRNPDALPRQVWVIDSTPAAREPGGSAWEMLSVLRALTGPFESRTGGVEALESEGIARPVARWMATNLEESDDGSGWRWRIDADVMEALLTDFFGRDLWEVVESPPGSTEVHLVKATESGVLSGADLERAERAAAASPKVHLHRVEGGHWLNADNPEALVELLAAEL